MCVMFPTAVSFESLQCEMDPDTAEPTDKLTPQARHAIEQLGCQSTSISQIVEQQDKAVFTAIQEGLNRANSRSLSRAQKVSTTLIPAAL